MKGLELARKYYEEYGRELIDTKFHDFADRICVGLVGEGSECLGFDDKISTDHDFEPAFCLFITNNNRASCSMFFVMGMSNMYIFNICYTNFLPVCHLHPP